MDFQELLRSVKEANEGAGETIATLGSGMAAAPIAGVRGVAGWLHEMTAGSRNPGEAYRRALGLIEDTQRDLTYQPRTDLGRRGVENVAKGIHAVTEPIARETTDRIAEAGAPGLAAGLVGAAAVLDPTKGLGRAKGAVEAAASAAARAAAKPKGWEAGVTAGEAAARRMVQESGLGLAEKPVAPRSDPGSPQGLIPGVEPLTPQEALRSAELARQRAIERATFTDKPTEVRYTYDPESSRQYSAEPVGEHGGEAVFGRGNPTLWDFGIDPRLGTVRGEQIYTRAGAPLAQDPLAFIGGAGGRPDLASRLRAKAEDVAAAERDVAARTGDVVRAEEIAPREADIASMRARREENLTPRERNDLEHAIFREKRDLPIVDAEGTIWRGEQYGGSQQPGTMLYRPREGYGDWIRPHELGDAHPELLAHQQRMWEQGALAAEARESMQDALRAGAVERAHRQFTSDTAAIERMRARRGEGTAEQQLGREQDIMRMKEELPIVHEGNAWQRSGYYYEPLEPGTSPRNIRVREAEPGSPLAAHRDMLEAQQGILDKAELAADRARREGAVQEAITRGSELEEQIAALREGRDPNAPIPAQLARERSIIGMKYDVPVVDRTENLIYRPQARSRGGEPTFERTDRSGSYDAAEFENPTLQSDAQQLADRIVESQEMIGSLERESARQRAAQLQARAERVRGLGDPNDVTDAARRSRIIRDLIAREPVVQEGEVLRGVPRASDMQYSGSTTARGAPFSRPEGSPPAHTPIERHAERYGQAQREHVQNIRTRNAVLDFLNEQEAARAATRQEPAWVQDLPRGKMDLPTPEQRYARESELYDVLGGERPLPRLTERPDFQTRDPANMNRAAIDAYIKALRENPSALEFGPASPQHIAEDLPALAKAWSDRLGKKIDIREGNDGNIVMTMEGKGGKQSTVSMYDLERSLEEGDPVNMGSTAGRSAGGGGPLYQMAWEHIGARGGTSGVDTLLFPNEIRILSNVISHHLRTGENIRDLGKTTSGQAPKVRGTSQDLPAIMRAEAEAAAERTGSSYGTAENPIKSRTVWFDGENFRIGNDIAGPKDIHNRIMELSPRGFKEYGGRDATGVGPRTLMRGALFDYFRALPVGTPIDEGAVKRAIDAVIRKYGPVAALGGGAIGTKTMQDELRDVA